VFTLPSIGLKPRGSSQHFYKLWKGKELEIIIPSVALNFAKIVDDFILYVVLGIDEQWRRQLAQIIIPTPIALREYVREVIGQ